MKRREFINWAGLGLIASYLPVALVACSKSESVADSNDSSNTANAEEALTIGTMSQLQEAGFLLDEKAKVLVIKNSQEELMAVNPTCTHQGCIVDWNAEENQFICPCHNAKFAPDGKVTGTPAQSDLSTYQVQEDNGDILVSLS